MPYSATITRLPTFALFDLKGAPETLAAWAPSLPVSPKAPNTLTRHEGRELCFIGPNRHLLRADITEEDTLMETLRPSEAPPEISIVRVSDTLTFFRITGADAAQIMAIGCPLDTHETIFGEDAVSYTEFFGIRALLLRCEDGFDCAVELSFGDMIADYLARAMA
ncbi:unnamed protein product [Ectocarpus sp. 12 AP-2014]